MTPKPRQPPLAVTPLEDRVLAAVLAPPQAALAPQLRAIPAKVSFAAPDPSLIRVEGGADGIMGIRLNHNETFVRRKRRSG